MKNAFMVLAVALAALPCRPVLADKPDAVAATFAANDFYRTCLKLDLRGLPTPCQMDRLASLFTPDLTRMIEDARRHRAGLIRENPAVRQPWRQGNLFTSLDRGFTFSAIGVPLVQDDIATVPVHLEYRAYGRVTRWFDMLVLVRSGRHWLVQDIFLNAPWPLTTGASLRTRLLMPMNEVTLSTAEEVASATPD
jgi:hypothetical protein